MTNESTHKVSFHGTGSQLFGVQIVNLLLTIITLGIYYPWARAKTLKYMYSETEFFESRFTFHGTGKELFMGFIKIIGIFAIIFGIYMALVLTGNKILLFVGLTFYFVSIFTLVPIAIHGSLRYRLSRSSWRSIHFGYRGIFKPFFYMYMKGIFFTIITLGIYSFWFDVDIRRYIYKHIRFGNVTFNFEGDGKTLLWMNLKGMFLTIITLGIYAFWFFKDLYAYYLKESSVQQDENNYAFNSNVTGGGIFWLFFTNSLLVLFTFGIGLPWATVRQIKYFVGNTELIGDFNPDAIKQTEEDYKNAAGENISDFLDLGLF